jgi:hypothetical protein
LIELTAVVGGCLIAWQAARHIPLAGILLGMPGKAKPRPTSPEQLAPA